MTSFNEHLAQGNAWLFIPAAIVLGAMHGLEPGHSKTMMAAFIVAIRGTLRQAVLLGLAATISHTAVIWALAYVGLKYSGQFDPERTGPYFQIVTGVMVTGMAVWMFMRTRREARAAHHHHGHSHDGEGQGAHGDSQDGQMAGSRFEEDHHHHPHEMEDGDFEDAHEREHAAEIEKRFAHRTVTTGQIILFGLTGGLMPCPAAFAVLLVCLQLKKFTLGFALVMAFSLGLALTLVGVGAIAAISIRHAGRHFKGFGAFVRRAPCISSVLLALIGLVIAAQGMTHLSH
jgi:ABC-type nickel/cobalt efflux system permease component RcnA